MSTKSPKGNSLKKRLVETFQSEEAFKEVFINGNRGKPIFLVELQNIKLNNMEQFIQAIPEHVGKVNEEEVTNFHYYAHGDFASLMIGVTPTDDRSNSSLPNIDAAMGRYHDAVYRDIKCSFDFGVGRTQCNFVSDLEEIFVELQHSAAKNLRDNLVRWSWTYLNRANDYFANEEANAVIQPIIYFDRKSETFNMKGGEVFVGGNLYRSYADLMRDIPEDQDFNRFELLILEKLVMGCNGAPGLLKFNISPQTLIDTFSDKSRVDRFQELIGEQNLHSNNVRLELVEKPYEEINGSLKDACAFFWNYGVSFAADDFGVKSQSHQVVLDLGEMIKEFKLDPISFKFKAAEDHTKFLDNLAFIDYCIRLADNRDAIITAEAVDDYDTLRFLLAHQISYFQANLFSGKLSIKEYSERYDQMQNLPEESVREILSDPKLFDRQKKIGNIFLLAEELKLV
jgi:EAL domain-containing protein (putative c-di-GMP-specific phosphodiesterase class I)